jgi:hypothetical protein
VVAEGIKPVERPPVTDPRHKTAVQVNRRPVAGIGIREEAGDVHGDRVSQGSFVFIHQLVGKGDLHRLALLRHDHPAQVFEVAVLAIAPQGGAGPVAGDEGRFARGHEVGMQHLPELAEVDGVVRCSPQGPDVGPIRSRHRDAGVPQAGDGVRPFGQPHAVGKEALGKGLGLRPLQPLAQVELPGDGCHGRPGPHDLEKFSPIHILLLFSWTYVQDLFPEIGRG